MGIKMDDVKAVVGTNAWGSAVYETMLRGSAVDEETLKAAVGKAVGLGGQDLGKIYPHVW